MTSHDTARLEMPLIQPAQAQKHVTVNEALMRIDGAVNLVLISVTVNVPPVSVRDGDCWAVPADARDGWAGHSGKIAVASNGGWVFMPVWPGMRAFVLDRGVVAVHDGLDWVLGALTLGRHGSGLLGGMAEKEFVVGQGARIETNLTIPGGVMVVGAVARVIEPLGGTVTSWQLGSSDAGAENRFGAGLGTEKGSWARGILSYPTAYHNPEKLIMTAEKGAFNGGRVRLAVHWLGLRLPQSVD